MPFAFDEGGWTLSDDDRGNNQHRANGVYYTQPFAQKDGTSSGAEDQCNANHMACRKLQLGDDIFASNCRAIWQTATTHIGNYETLDFN